MDKFVRMFSIGTNGARQWLDATNGMKTDINEFGVWKNVFAVKFEVKPRNDLIW